MSGIGKRHAKKRHHPLLSHPHPPTSILLYPKRRLAGAIGAREARDAPGRAHGHRRTGGVGHGGEEEPELCVERCGLRIGGRGEREGYTMDFLEEVVFSFQWRVP